MFLVHYLIFYSYIIVHNVTHMWRTKICDAQNFVTHKNFLLFLPLFKLIWNLRIHFTIIYLWVCTTWKKYSLQNIWQKNSQRYGIFSGPFFCKRPNYLWIVVNLFDILPFYEYSSLLIPLCIIPKHGSNMGIIVLYICHIV